MNVFELSGVACPVAGAIGGGISVKTPSTLWIVLGVGAGGVIGLMLYLLAIGLVALLIRRGRLFAPAPLNRRQWLASMAAVLLPILSPFAAWTVSVLVVERLMHL
jgi:hypothetical protein